MPRIYYLLLFACLVFSQHVSARSTFDPNVAVLSPDEKYLVRASKDLQNYEIVDTQTGNIKETFIMYATPSSVKWTKDSKTIVSVEHRAGGSTLILMTLKQKAWEYFEPVIPGDLSQHHCGVDHVTIGRRSVRVEYRVTREKSNGLQIGYYICSFTIATDTNAITDVVRRNISGRMFSRLNDLNQ